MQPNWTILRKMKMIYVFGSQRCVAWEFVNRLQFEFNIYVPSVRYKSYTIHNFASVQGGNTS